MEAWLNSLLDKIPSPLRGAAKWLLSGVIQVFRWVDGLARRVRVAWNRFTTAAQTLRGGIIYMGTELYTTLRWLVTVRIPRAITDATNRIHSALAALIARVQAEVAAALDAAMRWLRGILASLWAAVRDLRAWVANLVSPWVNRVRDLVARVFDTWATPARLAQWLVGAMWSALWGYVDRNLDRLVMAAWSRRRGLEGWALARLVELIGRIL